MAKVLALGKSLVMDTLATGSGLISLNLGILRGRGTWEDRERNVSIIERGFKVGKYNELGKNRSSTESWERGYL